MMQSEAHAHETVQSSYDRLKALIRDMGKVVVAFSGGVDSSLLLAAAVDALGGKALSVTARAPMYPPHELEQAVAIARMLGARHVVIDSCELDDPAFVRNAPDRCYHCKHGLFGRLRELAEREGGAVVLDGTNQDDLSDYRPGRQAAEELGVRSPLAELGYGKDMVRAMARMRGLPNWDQPACPCLASRIPYGHEITRSKLARVGTAEAEIRALGFTLVRVRDHGDLARIELRAEELERGLDAAVRRKIVEVCRAVGYVYVALDLEGYRQGAMNEVLSRGGEAKNASAPQV